MSSYSDSPRNSGLDFSDGPRNRGPYQASSTTGSSHLERNKSERYRLQGLMRVRSTTPSLLPETKRLRIKERWARWMVNEGGRQLFFAVFIFLHLLLVALSFVHYDLKDNLTQARATFGITYPIARMAAQVLHVDVIFILFPICRNFISLLRRTPLNQVIPFDKALGLHKATGWSLVVFTVIHIAAHMNNFAELAKAMATSPKDRFVAFLGANFATGPGATGWIMTVALFFIVYYSQEKKRRLNYERFWYSHHLFIIFFICWQLHGMFCMIKPDRPPFCSFNSIGVFWRYWLVGGVLWVYERILREVRSRHRTYISKVIQHPSKVMEIQIKKEKTVTRAGQYVFLCCPEVSYFQWHPFTLTSAPEEDYISIHIRVVGDFTSALARALGCDFTIDDDDDDSIINGKEVKKPKMDSRVISTQANPPINRVLPRVMIDGPFGSASEDFLKFETVLLVGGGIGVTPFASILKSIWYRMNNFAQNKPTRLSKVYFVWVIRDFGYAEWFHSLLHAIEEQDTQNKIEISIYLTAKLKEDDMNNILVQDVGADRDAITSLRAPTHFGRPNWDRVFSSVGEKHSDSDVGVFYCGPPSLSRTLHQMCNKYTSSKGTRFFYGKENF